MALSRMFAKIVVMSYILHFGKVHISDLYRNSDPLLPGEREFIVADDIQHPV